MKSFYIFLILGLASISEAKLNINYDKYWAQTLIGSDLAKEELKNQDATRDVKISIFDEFFNLKTLNQLDTNALINVPLENYVEADSHGNNVAYLIQGGPDLVSGTNKAKIIHLSIIESYKDEVLKMIGLNLVPELANVSHDNRPAIYEYENEENLKVKKVLGEEIIFTCSSGNYYPSPADKVNTSQCLQVGSINHHGFVSHFSMEGPSVDILVPSDVDLASFDGKNETLFGGTSGSAPQLLAALANLFSLYPRGFFNASLIKKLLSRTNLEVSQTKLTKVNGKGVLNSYKLTKLGIKLRNKKFNTHSINKALQELELEGEIYLDLYYKSNDEGEKIKLLRKAFLLGDYLVQLKASKLLAKLLKLNGYIKASQFYYHYSSSFIVSEQRLLRYKGLELFSATRFWFDNYSPDIKVVKQNFKEMKIEAKFAVLAELAQTKAEADFLRSNINSTDVSSSFSDMTLGDWSSYLLKKFYN